MEAGVEIKEMEMLIGMGMFRMKEEQIKERIREIVMEIKGEEISAEKIREITKSIKGSLSEEIIRERERL